MSDINLFPQDIQTTKNAISNINNTIDNSTNGFHFFNDNEYSINTMSSILSPMNMNEMSNIMRANNMSDFLAMTPLHISTSTTTKSPVINSLMNDEYTSYTTPVVNKDTTVNNTSLLNLDSVSNSTSNTNIIADTNDTQLPVKEQPTDKSKPLEYSLSSSAMEYHPPSLPSTDIYWQQPQQTSQYMPYGMSAMNMNGALMNPLLNVNPYVANEWFRYWPAFAFLHAQQMMQYQQPMNINGIQMDVKIEEEFNGNIVHLKPGKSKKKKKNRKRNISNITQQPYHTCTAASLENTPVKKRKLNTNITKDIKTEIFDHQSCVKRKRGRPRKYFTAKKRAKLQLPSITSANENEEVLRQNLNLEQLRRYVELVRARQLSYDGEELYVGIKTEDGSVKIRIPKTPTDCGNIPYSVFGTACSARIEDILEAKPRTRYVRGLNDVEKKTRRREQNRTAAARSRARKNAMIAKVIQLHSENMGYRIFVAEKIREIRLLREQVFAHRLQLKKLNTDKNGSCVDVVNVNEMDTGQRVEVEGCTSQSLGFCRTAKLHCNDILENTHSISTVPSVAKISPLFDIISETNPFGNQ